mgnify:CR=1 FL=1
MLPSSSCCSWPVPVRKYVSYLLLMVSGSQLKMWSNARLALFRIPTQQQQREDNDKCKPCHMQIHCTYHYPYRNQQVHSNLTKTYRGGMYNMSPHCKVTDCVGILCSGSSKMRRERPRSSRAFSSSSVNSCISTRHSLVPSPVQIREWRSSK